MDIWQCKPSPKGDLDQASRITHMEAAIWAGVGVSGFDALSNERQAEIVAGYLTVNRRDSVVMHYSRKDVEGGGMAIPQIDDED